MQNKYIDLVNKFNDLPEEEKEKEILNNIEELLKLLYITNKTYDISGEVLPVIKDYNNKYDYYDALFTRIISLKEETAKLINSTKN